MDDEDVSAEIDLSMMVLDNGHPYDPGKITLRFYKDGSMSLWGEGDGETIYLYREQAELLVKALALRPHIVCAKGE